MQAGQPVGSTAQQVSSENSSLVASNRDLTARVKELEAQLAARREELKGVRTVMLEMQVRGREGGRESGGGE
jgi:hypothetical protein